MPTVSDAFRELLQRIELNPTRVRTAATRYNAVKAVVEKEIPGATVRRIGSFQRNTKIRPLDLSDHLDVDAAAVLGGTSQYAPPGQGLTPKAAVEKVRRALARDKTYRLMEPVADAPVVALNYADDFSMEVAVAFIDLTGTYPHPGGPACYLVAGADGWKPADYDYDAEYISSLNQNVLQGTLVPLIKLAKRTFRTWKVPLGSFHTEVLVTTVVPHGILGWIAQRKTWGYEHALSYLLANAHEALRGPISLPKSFSPPVDSGLSTEDLADIGQFLKGRATTAWSICGYDDPARAIGRWADLLGEPFPALSSLYA